MNHDGISLAQAIALLEALYLQGWGEVTFKCQGHVVVHAFFGQSVKSNEQVDKIVAAIISSKKDVVTSGEGA